MDGYEDTHDLDMPFERGIPGGIRKLFFTLPPSTYKREVMEKITS
jgi:hypothetical protein